MRLHKNSSVKILIRTLQCWACLAVAASLCACGATAVIPAGATAETASGSELGLLLPEEKGDSSQALLAALSLLPQTAETAILLPESVQLEVRNIDQNPELPNGCEITSAAIVLNYLGIAADKVTLAEQYLPTAEWYWEADPNVEFMGNPADELAFYCLPGAVVTAVNNYLDDAGSEYEALDISGAGMEDLYRFVANGVPVLVWTTRAFSDPLYNYTFQLPGGGWPYSNSHCLVLTGYDAENCYVADPMLEVTQTDRATFAQSYIDRGRYAMVILPEE